MVRQLMTEVLIRTSVSYLDDKDGLNISYIHLMCYNFL